jgi:hypothetical protein
MNLEFAADISVNEAGYRWHDFGDGEGVGDHSGLGLIRNIPFELQRGLESYELMRIYRDTPHRQYDPFVEEPALFYVFAELTISPDSIRTFANRYGPFSGAEIAYYDEWSDAVRYMNEVIRLWQSIRRRDVGEIEKLFRAWSGREEYEDANDEDILRDAQETLTLTLRNKALDLNVLFLDFDLTPGLLSSGAVVLRSCTRSLWQAMWQQLLLAVFESKEFRRCVWCNRPFEASASRPGTKRRGRSDRVFCTDSCRVKSYLRRRERAVKMRAEGKRLRDIAKAVNTDMKTLKNWLKEA